MVDTSEADTERSVSPRAAPFVGLFLVAMGLLVVAMSADLIHVEPDQFHAPRWVAAAAGLAFVLAGLILLISNHSAPKLQGLLGAFVVTLLAAVANWVAFGPGERRFSGVFSVGFWHSGANPRGTRWPHCFRNWCCDS